MTTSYADANPAIESPSARVKSWPWERIGLALLLLGTAVSFLWGLDRNGWANPYYSAAAQAGSQDWKAFFFGSLDAGNLITIDKPPLSIWIMALSVRLFGLNSWAILVPQALMGIATTWLIYKIIRRSYPAAPALLGGLIYATTPVVVLMSRYNNPEPLMGLLTVSAVYFIVRAIEDNRWTWYLFSGTALGLAFMAKQIQAFLPVPAMVVAVLLLGAGTIGSRLIRLLGSLVSLILSGGWWIAIVELTPKTNRPYIGGSATNSILELSLDYNGIARFIQVPTKISGGRALPNDDLAPYNGGFTRIFDGNFAPEIAWLTFTAIMLTIVMIILNRSLQFTQSQKVLAVISTAWFSTTFLLLCFMGSMIHTYYTYSLAAPMAVVAAVGLAALWRGRDRLIVRLIGGLIVGSSTYMCLRVMNYSDEWPTIFKLLTITVGVAAVIGWMFNRGVKQSRLAAVTVAVALVLAPTGANFYTLSTPQNGTNPQSGPVANDPMAMSRLLRAAKSGSPAWAQQIAFGTPPLAEVTEKLRHTKNSSVWAAATFSAQNAALYQLESGQPVIALGGWLGTDPAPDLNQFKTLVAEGNLRYFIWQQDLLDRGELSLATIEISQWVQEHFAEQMVGNVKIYDLANEPS
ncbi:4-amino-4-deoxy-L-arabinose transferase [Pseudarthrobacter enclensis]|uniref:Glycosyl transferase n=1 Tax=Pseudarthrobacter enclensis TaxID=993070 RepID=A0A0V8IVW1_9MICC|nr:glycosyltransferase family 39 protein [Pseudarthrobacter enclensis]KSU78939.1 glycosyl transferase [Pseudarthrobacter enclensis]SCB80039.1 4-amino-4-deoxy-L-arabinose transferase [Pseudarthrobacter enclensis]